MEEFNIENRHPESDKVVSMKEYTTSIEENKIIDLSTLDTKKYLLEDYFCQILAYDYGGHFYVDIVQIDINALEQLPLYVRRNIDEQFLMGYSVRKDYLIKNFKFIGWCKIDDKLF